MSKKSDDKIADGLTIVFFIGLFCIIAWMAFRAGFPDIIIAHPNDKTWIDYIAAFAGPFTGMIAIGIAWYSNRQARSNLDRQMAAERFRYNNNLSQQMSRDAISQRRFDKQIDEQIKLDKKADDRQQAEWDRRDKESLSERNVKRRSIRGSLISELKACVSRAQIALEIHESNSKKEKITVNPDAFNIRRPVFENIGADVILLKADVISVLVNFEGLYKDAYESMVKTALALRECNSDDNQSLANIHARHLTENNKMFQRVCDEYIQALDVCS